VLVLGLTRKFCLNTGYVVDWTATVG
jgi:hypothetical protein